jgi:nitrogenase molybdenum-iron protein NifN
MPLMHGAQGCTSFAKVYFTRHFCEPIAIQTTSVTDVTAVLDGGDWNIVEAVRNIAGKSAPALVGLYTTGLTETKGDDIRGVASRVDYPLVWVSTPDYEGGLESGWALTAKALIEQLTAPASTVDDNKVVLLPHVSLQPVEVEKLKQFIAGFGFEALALPDLSTSLDGHLGEQQSALSGGGITVADIRALADARLIISVGESMLPAVRALQKKNPALRHLHFPHLSGLAATDLLAERLLIETGCVRPNAEIIRWRKRLQDALLDCQFALGQTRILVVGEADFLAGTCRLLQEAGAKVTVAVASGDSPQLAGLPAVRVLVGDLEDAEELRDEFDLIVGNGHVEALAHRHHKGVVLRGFPDWETLGNQLKHDVLYEGGAYFLFEVANAAERLRHTQVLTHKTA